MKPKLFKVYFEPNRAQPQIKQYHFPYEYEKAGVNNIVVTKIDEITFWESTWQFSHYKPSLALCVCDPWVLLNSIPSDVAREFIDTCFTRDGKQ
jgi:hypothetical protein